MAHYHVSKKETIEICNAQPGNCPLNSYHFSSQEEGDKWLIKYQEEKAFTSAKTLYSGTYELTMKNKNSLAYKVFNISPFTTAGFNYETYMSAGYAISMGLDNALIKKENGWKLANKVDLTKEELQHLIKRANHVIAKNYETKNGSKTCRAIYFNNSDVKGDLFIQTGSPEMLDGIKVDKKNQTKLLEIKKTHKGGAQLSQTNLSITSDGSFEVTNNRYGEEVVEALKNSNLYDTDKNTIELKVPQEVALKQFVSDYKDKKTDELVYTNNKGQVKAIDMNRPTDTIIKEMKKEGFKCQLKVRTNLHDKKMDNDSNRRFKENKNNLYNGNIDKDGNITLDQLNKGKFVKTGSYVRMGEFKLPIKWNDRFTLPKDTKINIKDLTYFNPILSGQIEVK